ncbi:MAG: alpha/beta fold hydrolase [Phycisphaerae bacterium]
MTQTCERFVPSGDLQLWTQAFGDAADPTILLIMGATNQGILWPDEFCFALARGDFRVIRYDHRDTGGSSTVNFRTSPYDMNDMTRDAVAILDAYGVDRAHIVGMSMGGFIAQLMALDFADRVRTLTLLMSSPDERAYLAAARGQDTGDYPLPPPAPRLLAHMRKARLSPPRTDNEYIEDAVESWRICNGEALPFDADAMYRLQVRVRQRTNNPAAALRHFAAVAATPSRRERLGGITAPTLVIHGEQDPCLPVEHGRALANAIPGAKLVTIAEMGHMLHPSLIHRIAEMILAHMQAQRA